jgi:hypothetical protein
VLIQVFNAPYRGIAREMKMKKFEPLPVPRSFGGEFSLEGVVEVGGVPYCLFRERLADQRNQWISALHLVPFVEEKKL